MERLTREPGSVGREDVEALRDAGFDDRMIHDAAAVTGYFAFVNRLADGLGVELEPYWDEHAPTGRSGARDSPAE
ncbi:MAG: hypothetical protein R3326_07120 [Gemmatimonadota bacterium]|nr:hypothetical protein [Gemmatimonadota bacterium]